MMAAVGRFGATVKRPKTKQIVFYYAGCGTQIDWRNYPLPVDAVVQNSEHRRGIAAAGRRLERLQQTV